MQKINKFLLFTLYSHRPYHSPSNLPSLTSLQEASKFARHAKRTYITPEDVNNAFKLKNVEPIYGLCSSSDPARFTRAAGQADIVYAEDPVIPLSKILDAPLPPLPWEAGVTVHWMAVNGKQPAIPENMPLVPPSHRDKRQRTEAARKTLPALAVPAEVAAIVPADGGDADAAAAGAAGATTTPGAATGAFEEGALVRAPLKHVVSKELHLYYNKAITALESAAPPPAPASKELLAVLSSLRTDAGVQPLAPYFAHYLAEKVGLYLASAPRLSLLLRAAVSLGSNPALDLGPYLHEIIPAVLTCLLAHSVGESANEKDDGGADGDGKNKKKSSKIEGDADNLLDSDALHWNVREEASRAAAALCFTYPDAAPRVQRQLLAILTSQTSSLPSRYGAVLGLEAQGPRVVRSLLLPNLIPAVVALKEDLSGKNGSKKLLGALRVRGALLAACGYCVYLSGVCAAWNSSTSTGQGKGGNGGEKEEEEEGEGTEKEGAAAAAAAVGGKRKKAPATTSASAAGSKKKKGGKVQPKIANMSRADAEEALAEAATSGGGGAKKGRGAKKGATAATATATATTKKDTIPIDISEIFGEEDEPDAATSASLAAAGQTSLKKVLTISGNMRPTNKDNPNLTISSSTTDKNTSTTNSTTVVQYPSVSGLVVDTLPSVNYLADAWQENFPVERLHRAMEELFGDDIAPYER